MGGYAVYLGFKEKPGGLDEILIEEGFVRLKTETSLGIQTTSYQLWDDDEGVIDFYYSDGIDDEETEEWSERAPDEKIIATATIFIDCKGNGSLYEKIVDLEKKLMRKYSLLHYFYAYDTKLSSTSEDLESLYG